MRGFVTVRRTLLLGALLMAGAGLLGVAREVGVDRRLALTGELGVEAYHQTYRGTVSGFTPSTQWRTAPLAAAGIAYRRPVGRRLELRVHARYFAALSTGFGVPLAQSPQAAVTLGVSRR